MSTLNRLTLALSLVTLLAIIASCNKSKNYDFQSTEDVSLQINRFNIKSSTDSTLSAIAFSIENKTNGGEISNAQPIPYGKSLSEVTLPINFISSLSVNKREVTVAVGNQAPKVWTDTTKYNIPADVRTLTIEIRDATEGRKEQRSYTYVVKIRQYSQSTEKIQWTDDTSSLLSLSSPYTSTTGLPTGVTLSRISSYNENTYALGSNGILYQYTSGYWQEQVIVGISNITDLLGLLPSVDNTLNIILRNANNQCIVYTPQKQESKTISLQAGFPNISDDIQSYGAYTKAYVGGSSTLIVALKSGIVQTWTYTEGSKKWAKTGEQKLHYTPISSSVCYSDGTYYLISSTLDGVKIAYSTDRLKWIESNNESISGIEGHLAQSTAIQTWANGNTLYILDKSTRTSPRLYKGTILKHNTNF